MAGTYTSLLSALGINGSEISDDTPIKYHTRPSSMRSQRASRPTTMSGQSVSRTRYGDVQSSPESIIKGKKTDFGADKEDLGKLEEVIRIASINAEEGLYDYIFVGIISQYIDTVASLVSNVGIDSDLWSLFFDLKECQAHVMKQANATTSRSRLILIGPLVSIDCLYNSIPLHILTSSQVFAFVPSSGQGFKRQRDCLIKPRIGHRSSNDLELASDRRFGGDLVPLDLRSLVGCERKLLAMFDENSLAGKALRIISISRCSKRIRLVMLLACWLFRERNLVSESAQSYECRGPRCTSFSCQVGQSLLTVLGLEIQGLISFRPMPAKLRTAIHWNAKRDVFHTHILDLTCDSVLSK